MKEPLVSVIIPCFRQGAFLADAIACALGQSRVSTEVIVVDDGSDDETGAVAGSFDRQIQYIRQENRGPSAARNAGIRVAGGRYLLFLDADDLLDSRALAWAISPMRGREDAIGLMGFRSFEGDLGQALDDDCLPSASFEQFRLAFASDPLLRVAPPSTALHERALLPYLFYTTFGPPHCWLSSRKLVLEVGGFDESLRGCADWDLWLRMALAGARLVSTENVGAFYRRSPTSMSADELHMIEDRARVLIKCVDSLIARRELILSWGVHLLQAARRARRRWIVRGLSSRLLDELSGRIAALRHALGRADPAPICARIVERFSAFGLDRLALMVYRRTRPALVAYYESEIN